MAMPDAPRQNRPDPDALLSLAKREERGRLTVFLGAAPGVGKTFAMLSRAARLHADGVDIVVGLAETHGRAETAELLEGLPILPRREVDYRGKAIAEFDLDAALARRPTILIVDELAHSNPPACRHPKRYQDVEELLEAGIHVWTAINIQHLESLSDVVSQITGIAVRETVPDRIINEADDIVLIDLPPDELIERLKQGKVYVPDNARRAIEKFFRPGNLTALREMALRRTADRVDDQMVDYLRQNAIDETWPTTERLIVCVAADAVALSVVRAASRLAVSLNARWTVVHVERPERPSEGAALAQVDEALDLATRLGAETLRLTASDYVAALLKLARKENATQIVIGVSRRGTLSRWLRPSLASSLIRRAEGLSIHLVTAESTRRESRDRALADRKAWPDIARDLAVSAACVTAATLTGLVLNSLLPLPNVSLLYLLAVVAAAIRNGYRAAIITAVLSALAYNFCFIPPISTLTIAAPHEVFAFLVFIMAAVVAGGIASRVRDQARSAAERARVTQSLYEFSSKISATADADEVVWAAVSQLNAMLKRPIVILMPRRGELTAISAWPPDATLEVIDTAAARWAYDRHEAAGAGTGTLPSSGFQFRPLETPQGVIGVCGYGFGGAPLSGSDERIFGAVIHQVAVAIDRARLSKAAMEHTAALAGERFRSALLSSISHDLRTPLATITGAISSLRQLGDRMSAETREDMLQTIDEEGTRLARYVSNLLDMTRIEAGTIQPAAEWIDPADVVREAADMGRRNHPGVEIETSIAASMPLIRADAVLLQQVLFNLIDNAVKHGGPEPIAIYARPDGGNVMISVTDLGKGIPRPDLGKVFEKFFRGGARSDGRTIGTGLGLAIAKGFVEAMGGTIVVASPAVRKRGTRFTIRLPIPEQPDLEGES
jgi:two-component system sensor histidine kinase KdpD